MREAHNANHGFRKGDVAGWAELTSWHKQRILVKVSSIEWFMEHQADSGQFGARLFAGGEVIFVADTFHRLLNIVQAESYKHG